MRVAALYDIHGNLPALEAVLADVRASGADRIVVGGDVLPGPMPRECLELLGVSSIPVDYIRGNGDRETISARRGVMSAAIPEAIREVMLWNASQLLETDVVRIDQWPAMIKMPRGSGIVLFCHATPRNDTEIFSAATAEAKLRGIFEPLRVPVVVCGHTHMQFDRMVGSTRVINAGSVGMPFQAPGAYWLLIDEEIELRRTDYDLAAAAERVRRTGYPDAESFASRNILNPPSEESMIAAFANAELT